MGFFFSPFFLIWGGATIEGKGHFLCFFFVCARCWHNEEEDHKCHKHIGKPLFLIIRFFFFQKNLSTLKFWPIKAIYMCRLLQLKKLKKTKYPKLMQLWWKGQNVVNTLKNRNLIKLLLLSLLFLECFEILAPTTYLHFNTLPTRFFEKK
jgi:hypothetical protein